MARVIYKYDIPVGGRTVPYGKVVHVGHQHGAEPTIWVEQEASETGRMAVSVHATGEPLDSRDTVRHVGSAICGLCVWHVYVGG